MLYQFLSLDCIIALSFLPAQFFGRMKLLKIEAKRRSVESDGLIPFAAHQDVLFKAWLKG